MCMLLFHINFYFFSRNVKEDVAKRISEISKISVTTKLEKYLGVPSITGCVHVGLFQHVLDKVEGILDGWEAKLLSLAGRITLAQLVLNSIPLYSMQSTMLHIALCNSSLLCCISPCIWSHVKKRGQCSPCIKAEGNRRRDHPF